VKFDPNKLPVRRIEPHTGWMPLNLHEVYEYRRLLAIFVWRDVKARYKQTMAGVTRVIIQPVISMLVFSAYFSDGGWKCLQATFPTRYSFSAHWFHGPISCMP